MAEFQRPIEIAVHPYYWTALELLRKFVKEAVDVTWHEGALTGEAYWVPLTPMEKALLDSFGE